VPIEDWVVGRNQFGSRPSTEDPVIPSP